MAGAKGPIVCFGGKGNMRAKLLPLFPDHKVYVEAFGGGAAMLFAKQPAGLEVYNDLDSGLVGFFRVLRDPEQFKELHRLASLTPYAREEYNYARENWKEQEDPVKRAYLWYLVARWSFAGHHSFGTVTSTIVRNMSSTCSAWLSTIASLPDFHQRIMRVQIEQQDWRVILDRYDSPDTFFYLDPPYALETRKSGKYAHELTNTDQIELVERIQTLQGKVLLSGYPNAAYNALIDAGWGYKEWQVTATAAGRTKSTGLKGVGSATAKQSRTEAVWMNYTPGGCSQQSILEVASFA